MIGNLLEALAERHGDRTALVEADSRRSVTFLEFYEAACRVAAGLEESGVGPGQRVAYLGRNRIEFFELLFGCAMAGCVLAPLSWVLGHEQLKSLVEDLGAGLAIVDRDFDGRIDHVEIKVIGAGYEEWRDAQSANYAAQNLGGDTPVLQPYTSGTTGLPKGVQLTHSNLEAAFAAGSLMGYSPESVHLASLPNYHVGGNVNPLISTAAGGQIVMVNRFSAATVADLIPEFGITHVNFVPTVIDLLIEEQRAHPRDMSSLKLITYGAAPVNERTLALADAFLGAPMTQLYGSTECLLITNLPPAEHEGAKLGSVGRPFPEVELSLRDPNTGSEVQQGERAEICVRSEMCTQGYWERPQENADLFTWDGWVRTGDMGHIGADGMLYLDGRLNDMMITGGENVYPAEVEAVLARHPGVTEVAVIGLPDTKWGELITACVVPRDPEQFSPHAFLGWSHEHLSGYQRPRRVVVLAELPRNPTGKILRRDIKAAVAEAGHG